jgi:superfamily II DNA helicase RecQ
MASTVVHTDEAEGASGSHSHDALRRAVLRKFKHADYDSQDLDRTPMYRHTANKINELLRSHNITWEPRRWQVGITLDLIQGRDVILKAGTGSGKSLCFQLLSLLYPASVVLVVCPLLALMEDQANRARELGIDAVQVSAETIASDRQLLDKVRDGHYSMVFMAAEFTDPMHEGWRKLVREDNEGRATAFVRGLRAIVIDEVHLVYEW